MATKVRYEKTRKTAAQSAREIRHLIRKYKATRFREDYDDDGDICGIRFTMKMDDRELPIILKPAIDKVYELLTPEGESNWDTGVVVRRHKRRQKAKNIAWRQLYYLTEHMLLATEMGVKSFWQVFMADIEVYDAEADEEITLGEMFERRHAAGFLPPTRKMLNP